MHTESLRLMGRFVRCIPQLLGSGRMQVLDVGSYNVNGCYRELFLDHDYTGLDIMAGPNVDIIVANPYAWNELGHATFDVVISGQCLEHVEFPWLTMQEIKRCLRPGGICCIIVPSNGYEHRHPIDCYRFFPDGIRALAKWVNLEEVEITLNTGEIWVTAHHNHSWR
jgi:SAM-dependent methyltransferase